jgi:hypothetical protein
MGDLGSLRRSSGLGRGHGVLGREPASVMSSQMGNDSRVAARCGLRREGGMCESTGSERDRMVMSGDGTTLGGTGMAGRRLLVCGGAGGGALNGSGDGWRLRDGAAWELLRCWVLRLLPCRPRISAAGFSSGVASAAAGLGERAATGDTAAAGRGLGDDLYSFFAGFESERSPGVRVGWRTGTTGADACLRWCVL